MTYEFYEEPLSPHVSVSFKKSSSKDGAEGFDIDVQEGVDEAEADRVMSLALRLRERALGALRPPSLEKQLDASITALKVTNRHSPEALA